MPSMQPEETFDADGRHSVQAMYGAIKVCGIKRSSYRRLAGDQDAGWWTYHVYKSDIVEISAWLVPPNEFKA